MNHFEGSGEAASPQGVGLVLPNPAQTCAFLVFAGFITCSQGCT